MSGENPPNRPVTYRQVAAELGVTVGAVRGVLNDPDGSKQRTRRERYQGRCVDCGAPTDGSNGLAKAPTRCTACERTRVTKGHGTISSYRRGCRCEACCAAAAARARWWREKVYGTEPPRHGTASAYGTYGCRCDECRAYNVAKGRAYRERKREVAA